MIRPTTDRDEATNDDASGALTVTNANENVEEIKNLHDKILGHRRTTISSAIRIGELLTNEKERCGHSHWLDFVRDSFTFDVKTASNYMRVYRQRDMLPKLETVSDFTLTDAYLLLRKPQKIKIVPSPAPPQSDPGEDKPIDIEAVPPSGESEQPHVLVTTPSRRDSIADTPPVIQAADPVAAACPNTVAIISPTSAAPPGPDAPLPQTDQKHQPDDLVLVDGTVINPHEWHDGVIQTDRLKTKLSDSGRWCQMPRSRPVQEVVQYQRFLVHMASEVNRLLESDTSSVARDNIVETLNELMNVLNTATITNI